MTVQAKIGLALLAAGGLGLAWLNRKEAQLAPASNVQDIEHEVVDTSNLVDGSTFNKPTESKSVVNDETTNSLLKSFSEDSGKQNIIPTDLSNARVVDNDSDICDVAGF